jgi:hypothetical protein
VIFGMYEPATIKPSCALHFKSAPNCCGDRAGISSILKRLNTNDALQFCQSFLEADDQVTHVFTQASLLKLILEQVEKQVLKVYEPVRFEKPAS